MKQQTIPFLSRWALNSLMLWVTIRLFGTGKDDIVTAGLWGFLVAGLILSLANTLIKPFIMIVSLPAILLTLGLFTLIVNGIVVYIALAIAPGMSMSFWHSVLTGILISLVNYIVSASIEIRRQSRRTS